MGQVFGSFLLARRVATNLSGNKLSQLSGISQGTHRQIESGKRPPSDQNLAALANVQALQASLETLKTWRALDRVEGEDFVLILRWLASVSSITQEQIESVLTGLNQQIQTAEKAKTTQTELELFQGKPGASSITSIKQVYA